MNKQSNCNVIDFPKTKKEYTRLGVLGGCTDAFEAFSKSTDNMFSKRRKDNDDLNQKSINKTK